MEPLVEPVYVETRKAYKGQDIFMMRLNRPHRNNTIDTFLPEHLIIAFKAFQNSNAKAAILFGAGGTFSGGYDLAHFENLETDQLTKIFENATSDLPISTLCQKPIVAAVDGMCFNGGLELALNADHIVASENAMFNLLQFRVGFPLVDNGSLIIPKIIGTARAVELIKSGETFNAQEALAMGLINSIVPQNELQPVAYEIAKTMADQESQLNQHSVYRTFYGHMTKSNALNHVFIPP